MYMAAPMASLVPTVEHVHSWRSAVLKIIPDGRALIAAAGLLRAMAHPTRMSILITLRTRELSANGLHKETGIDRSMIDLHLVKLRALGLLRCRRKTKRLYYSCSSEAVERMLVTLDEVGQRPPLGGFCAC